MTAERFNKNPFSNKEGERFYRTGDLACYLPDGNIKFLGRIDQQVKVRGFRIEPGEIEAVLATHVAVQECIVLVREDAPGEKRLIAYVVLKQITSVSDLSSYLKENLPDYMIPSAFVILDALPLTLNGKVDRRELPIPDQIEHEQQDAFIEPRTPVEEKLENIFVEVLKCKRVDIHTNFFLIGGHSLLGMQLISRIRETFGIELPLRCLFESPTIASLAIAVTRSRNEGKNNRSNAINRNQQSPTNEQLLERVEELTNEEVHLLLSTMITEEEHN